MAENNGRGGAGEVGNGRRSDVWSHFVISKDSDGKDIATCKHCQKSLGAETKNGTTHLKRHLGSCARQDGPPAKQQRRPPPDDGPSAESSSVAGSVIRDLCEASSLALAYPAQGSSWSKNSQEECAAELARMVAFHGCPSSIVEDECFRSLVRGLNPQFQMPSRAAVEGLSNTRAVDAMKQLMETLAGCSGQISLATGTAETGQETALYMACQFIDDEWAFQKRIMQVFKAVIFPPHNHSTLQGAEEICLVLPEAILKQFSLQSTSSKIEEAVRRWGLGGRVFSVAWDRQLDKCLERRNFLDGLGTFIEIGAGAPVEIGPTVYCVTYTSYVLESVAVKFLQGLDPTFEVACLKATKDLHMSHEKRARCFSELGLHHIGRYGHRWYSYYCALEVLHKEHPEIGGSACAQDESMDVISSEFVDLIQRQTFGELQDRIEKHLWKLSFKQNVFTELLRKILGAIYRAIETISSPCSRPTSNICLEVLMELRTVLQSEAIAASSDLRKLLAHTTVGGFIPGKNASAVLIEAHHVLDEFLREAYLYLSIPAVLDPRFKKEYVRVALEKVFGKEDDDPDYYISEVNKTIQRTFGVHRRNLHSVISGEGTSHHMSAVTGTCRAMDIDDNSHGESITELERYLTDGLVSQEEGQGFDVLMWWKANSSRYPTVASMARDALAMPASDMLSPEHIARIRSMMSSYCLTYPQAPSDH